jgi:predicted nucleic acid-binding protein
MMSTCIEVEMDQLRGGFREIQEIARTHRLTAYAASYLYLARQHRLPLPTLDTLLEAAAKRSGISTL